MGIGKHHVAPSCSCKAVQNAQNTLRSIRINFVPACVTRNIRRSQCACSILEGMGHDTGDPGGNASPYHCGRCNWHCLSQPGQGSRRYVTAVSPVIAYEKKPSQNPSLGLLYPTLSSTRPVSMPQLSGDTVAAHLERFSDACAAARPQHLRADDDLTLCRCIC